MPNDGYVDAGVLSTDNLSQVTVSKGISSVLYGTNTMGGVINLVSRKPEKTFEGDIKLGAMEVDGYRAAINLGTRQDNWVPDGRASRLIGAPLTFQTTLMTRLIRKAATATMPNGKPAPVR